MRYRYRATDKNGQIVEDEMEAQNLSAVLNYLTSRGLKPIKVKPAKKKSKDITLFGGKIDLTDQIFIFRYLHLMLGIGTNLLQAINILIEDFEKPSVREFLIEVRTNLEQGSPFYTAFENHPKVFSDVHINLIKAAETAGNLEEVAGNITTSLQKEKELKDKIRNAMIYPALLLGISLLILIFLVTFALPRIAEVFLESGFEPPLFSQVVFSVGLFLGNIWGWILGGLTVLAVSSYYLYKKSLFFKKFIWSIISDIPVIKDVIKKRAIQRFASTTSNLVKAGIPITRSLKISADAAGNIELKDALERIVDEGLSKGLTLGEAFRKEPFFPNMVVNLIAIAEQAGHVEEVLGTLSDFYIKEIDNSIQRLVSFLEPMLLLFIGMVIGLIALAIIVPIYQLTTQF